MASRKDKKGRSLHIGESQRKDERYCYRYTDLTGKRHMVYANDLMELREKERMLQRDWEDNILTDASIKKLALNGLFERYAETKAWANTTRSNNQTMWENHVKNAIGNMKVVQLRVSNIKAFYMNLARAGYAHSTIKLLHTLIYPTLELAVEDDIIRKNPAKGALSKDCGFKEKEKNGLTIDQQAKMLAFTESSNVYNVYLPMITILLELGLRCGELIGLTWDDISISEKTASINHQHIYKNYGDGCRFHISSPKTEAGNRTLPLTEKAAKAFFDQKKMNFMLGRQSEMEIEGVSNFIFIGKNNRPYMPAAINNVLYNIVAAYNKDGTQRQLYHTGYLQPS